MELFQAVPQDIAELKAMLTQCRSDALGPGFELNSILDEGETAVDLTQNLFNRLQLLQQLTTTNQAMLSDLRRFNTEFKDLKTAKPPDQSLIEFVSTFHRSETDPEVTRFRTLSANIKQYSQHKGSTIDDYILRGIHLEPLQQIIQDLRDSNQPVPPEYEEQLEFLTTNKRT